MRSLLLGAVLVLFGGATAVNADESPRLGESLDEAATATFDFVVLPGGEGLPAGSGDAIRGAQLYDSNCLACHGIEGAGGINDVLVGGHRTLTGKLPNKTVGSYWPYATTLFDYIRRAMPYPEPGSLSNDEIYALTAYLLFLNGIVEEEDIMSAASLPKIEMPNRDNFVWAYRPD